jgi:hypothetical protein
MERKPMIDVLLIPEVLPYFAEYKHVLLKDCRYFHCSAVDPDDLYLKMRIPIHVPETDETFDALISIPHNFVLCILTAPVELEKTIHGFAKTTKETKNKP